MYWQKRFDREDPDAELLQKIKEIREEHKDYGYRRLWGELRKQGLAVNKKRVHRIVQKYGLQVTSYTRKSRRFSTYKGVVGRISPNRVNRSSIPAFLIRRELQILLNSSIMSLMRKAESQSRSCTLIHSWICGILKY